MFNTINYLLYDKSEPKLNSDLLEEFNPYLTIKAFSYYDSGSFCNHINDTINIYGNVFDTKEDQFNFLQAVIPKLKRKKIEYIKKSPKVDEDESEKIPEFLSKREIEMYENMLTNLK